MNQQYISPFCGQDAFNCPNCNTYAHQKWTFDDEIYPECPNLAIAFCDRCNIYSLWYEEKLVFPKIYTTPLPSENMPDDVKEDYLEARQVLNDSPRAATALLRLALQKLLAHIGGTGKNINRDIGTLVKEAKISPMIQKALDSVRIIGNESVHPGQIDMRDNQEIAIALFRILNVIVKEMITTPKEIDELFDILPANKKEGIKERDKI